MRRDGLEPACDRAERVATGRDEGGGGDDRVRHGWVVGCIVWLEGV